MKLLKRLLLKISSYFPRQLPNGMTALNQYLTDVISLAGAGIPDNRSTRFAVSTMIMHLGTDRNGYPKDSVPMNYFVRKLRKAAANEVAYAMLESMKKEQDQKKDATKNTATSPAKPELAVVT